MQNGKNAQPDFDSENLSPQDKHRIVQVGEQASQLLNNPVFNQAYRQVMDRKYIEWLDSAPKEVQKREGLFHQVKGLAEVTETLSQAVADANQVLAELHEENSPEGKRQAYESAQGFGLN